MQYNIERPYCCARCRSGPGVSAVRHVLRQQRGIGQVRRAVRGRGAHQHRV